MRLTKRFTIAVAVGLGLLSVAVVFATRMRTENERPPQPTSAQPRLEAERITVREWGFEPNEINRGPGPFLLGIQNQSGLEEIEISLVDSGNSRRKLPVTRNALMWKERVNLPPGTYLIKESGHPEWECRITIGNNN